MDITHGKNVNTRQFTGMAWGTQRPVILRDPEFGMVRVRAFGAFALRVTDPAALLRELAGTDPQFRTEEVQEYLRQLIVGRFGNALSTAQAPLRFQAANAIQTATANPGGAGEGHYATTFKLLPVWFLTYLHAGKPLQVMVNARTGEVIGERPYSAAKISAAVAGALVVIGVVVAVLMARSQH